MNKYRQIKRERRERVTERSREHRKSGKKDRESECVCVHAFVCVCV